MTKYSAPNGILQETENGVLMECKDHFMLMEEKRIEILNLKKELDDLRFKAECIEGLYQETL